MLTGDPLTEDEALSFGLVNSVLPAGEVLPAAKALAARLAGGAPMAIREILRAVTDGIDTSLEEGLNIESAEFKTVFISEDAREGAMAFFRSDLPIFRAGSVVVPSATGNDCPSGRYGMRTRTARCAKRWSCATGLPGWTATTEYSTGVWYLQQ